MQGPFSADDFEAMARGVDKEDPLSRFAEIRELADSGRKDPEAINILMGALRDDEPIVAEAAIDGLKRRIPGQTMGVSGQILEKFTQLLGVSDGSVNRKAFDALVESGKHAVPALLKALSGRNYYILIRAVWALGEIKENNPQAVQGLMALLNREHYIPSEAAWALGEIGAADAAKALIPLALRVDDEFNLRETAEAALVKIIDKCTDQLRLDELKVEVRTSVNPERRPEKTRAQRLFAMIKCRKDFLLATDTEDTTGIRSPPKPVTLIRPHRHILR